MDREDDERRRAQAWREEVRRKIDEGFEEALRGELLDGEQVLERLRQRIESRGKKGA
jgi:predicted transcriptional regulator